MTNFYNNRNSLQGQDKDFFFRGKIRIYGILLLGCIIIGLTCCRHKANEQLRMSQHFMEEYPDSSLNILRSMSLDQFTNDADKALYCLLYTQAMDKNYLSPTNDSIISLAVDFYMRGHDNLNQAIANYYQGRVRYNSNNYPLAIISFFKAKEIAENNGYDFWAGMACRGIADIYNGTYNSAEELTFAQKEYDLIKKSGKQPYLNYALHDLGKALCNNNVPHKSIPIAEQIMDSAIKYQDSYLYHNGAELHASSLILEKKFKEASSLLTEICQSDLATTLDTLYLCHSLLETGHTEEAMQLLESASTEDNPFGIQLRYEIAKNSNHYPQAILEAELLDSITNADFRSSMSHNLTSTLSEYFELQRKLDNTEIQAAHTKIWAIIFASSLLLALICGTVFFLYNRQNRKIAEKVFLVARLQEELNQSKSENSNSTDIIHSLISSKYELLEEVGSIVLLYNDSKVAHRKIAEVVNKIIEDLSIRSEKIISLEEQVDSIYNNLISDFKKDLPGLKDADYRLYLFSVIGLSNAIISLLLKEEKITTVYNRKRRLKDKIKLLDQAKQERYLAHFR